MTQPECVLIHYSSAERSDRRPGGGRLWQPSVPQVMSILLEVPTTHPEVLEDPEPSPIFTAFGSSSLDFELRVWIANIDGKPHIKSELLQQIEARFREGGIQIPFPQRDLHLRSIDSGVVENLKASE